MINLKNNFKKYCKTTLLKQYNKAECKNVKNHKKNKKRKTKVLSESIGSQAIMKRKVLLNCTFHRTKNKRLQKNAISTYITEKNEKLKKGAKVG